MSKTYYIALGSNLPGQNGESPKDTVLSAMDSLDDLASSGVVRSALYQTAPVPISDQPWYVNAVVAFDSEKAPLEILRELQVLENRAGRVRSERNAARILDLDIIAVDEECIELEGLSVPHPRMHQRGFVLFPMYDVAPTWRHPMLRQEIDALIQALPDAERATEAGRVA